MQPPTEARKRNELLLRGMLQALLQAMPQALRGALLGALLGGDGVGLPKAFVPEAPFPLPEFTLGAGVGLPFPRRKPDSEVVTITWHTRSAAQTMRA